VKPPNVVLGLCSFTHDSSAALLVDGHLVGFVEEERLVERKHTKEFPQRAVEWLLAEAGLTAGEVTAVGYNFRPGDYLAELPRTLAMAADPVRRDRAVARAAGFAKVAARTRYRLREIGQRFPAARVVAVKHHRAHQLAAFTASGWSESAVLVVDSLGERQTTTIAHARNAKQPRLRQVQAVDDPASLGYVYGAVTEHLGWRRGDEEGTVMALAALGDPARFRSLFAQAVPLTDTGFAVDPALFPVRVLTSGWSRTSPAFRQATCTPRRDREPIEQVHQDLAAALQERTEQVMLHLAHRAKELTGSRRLCLGGGVATNCVAVGRIIDSGLFEEVFVPPAPGDAGTALGAAAAVHTRVDTAHPLTGIHGACYLGPSYGEQDIDQALAAHPLLDGKALEEGDLARFLAERLAAGMVIGVFRGRVEAGPRALGNRSILASPLLPNVVERLNKVVKFREPFRPFAPMVTAERAEEFFSLGQQAPFMSMAARCTDAARSRVPAVVHANGTARLQTVTADQNPFIHALLEAFAEITGVPVLINTSLNIKGKPMCGTPQMALNCLTESGLDALLLEDRWVIR